MINRESLLKLLSHRPVRYVLVGGWNTALGYTMFAGFFLLGTHFHRNHIVASEMALIGSNTLGVIQAYFLYKYLVFRTPHLSWLEFLRFSSVYAIQLSANLVVLPILVATTHIHPLAAQAIVIPVFVLLTYLAHHHISFRHRKDTSKTNVSATAVPVSKQ